MKFIYKIEFYIEYKIDHYLMFQIKKQSYYSRIILLCGLFFIYWRNYCSILQITNYYDKSEVNTVLKYISTIDHNICTKYERQYRYILHDLIIKLVPFKKNKKIIEGILKLHYCFGNTFLSESMAYSLIKHEVVSDISIVLYENKQVMQNYYDKAGKTFHIIEDFDNQPNIIKEKYLLSVLSTLTTNIPFSTTNIQKIDNFNYIFTLLNELTEHSDILKSLKKGHYAMNIIESGKIELITKLNKLIFTIRDNQNKIEFFIKQILLETSYLFGLFINYFYFILWSISFIGIWTFISLKYNDKTILITNR